MKFTSSATIIHLLVAFTCNLSIMGLPECDVYDLDWDDLPRTDRFLFELDGWDSASWSKAETGRWHSMLDWESLSSYRKKNLMALGWDEEDWEDKMENECQYFRPLAELKPWSRLTPEEQNIAKDLGYNQLTWHVKEYEAMLGDEYYRNYHNISTHSPILSNKGFEVIKQKLNIPELSRVTFDELAKRHDVTVEVDDNIKTTREGNDSTSARIRMSLRDFTRRILLRGEQLYLKYEGEEQDVIREIAGTSDIAELMTKSFRGTPLEKLGDFGVAHDSYRFRDLSMFYVGAEGTKTTMHLDLLHFNFLWVVSGKKRVRLMPNDQRTKSMFTTGLETSFCVWNDYDLLKQPLPPHAVEVILGPGEGLYIPYYTWHAVENLEPSIAFGLIRDFHETASFKDCNYHSTTELHDW